MSNTVPIVRGDLRTLVRISLPLFLFLFCESLTLFCERIFLSYHGIEGVASSLNGIYLASIFQGPSIAIASMAQVFVGLHQGSGEIKRIGHSVWQFIWFSFLSLAITLPLGLWCSSFYFKGTSIEVAGPQYFNILAMGNFLFPLTIALYSFYLGRGKTLLVTSLLIASYACNLALCWILIFGIEGFIPSFGVRGAALAKCLSMGILSFTFFTFFLSQKNRQVYGTDAWQFSFSTLWSHVRPGTMRAFMYVWMKVGWVAISYMVIKKGGLYLDVLTVGGTVIALFLFIILGLYRTVLTVAPNLLGSKNYSEIGRLCGSLVLYVGIIGMILTIPLLLYPQLLTYFFDNASQELFEKVFKLINHWIWFYLVALTIQMGLCGIIMVAQDLKMQLYGSVITVLTSLLPVYLVIQLWGWQPDKLWLIMALENVILALIFFQRLYQKRWKEIPVAMSSQSRPI